MAELEPGAIFAGHRIEGVAGRGGFGVVYRATHLALDHVVALKVITTGRHEDETFRDRFKSESRIAVSIRHPNVVAVHNAGEEDGRLFVTMDFIEGTDLRGLLNRRGRLRPEQAVRIVGQVAAALDAAHERGLVHRDIKPGNVLIEERSGSQHVYLTDFGLSKQMDATSGVTASGAFVGTLDYVAPEQIKGERVDARTDVYALGCVMFELLSGELPFGQEEKVAKIYAHLQEPPPELRDAAPEVPVALSEVVWRAMEKDPERRFPSAGDLARAAEAAVEGRRPDEPERSVGVGAAAPTEAFDALAAGAAASGAGATAEAAAPDAVATPPPPPREPSTEAEPAAGAPAGRAPARAAGRRRLAVAGLGAAVLAAGAFALLGGGEDGGAPSGGGGSQGGAEVVGAPIAVPEAPVGITATGNDVWVSSREGGVLTRIDAKAAEVVGEPLPLEGDGEQLVQDEEGRIWVAVGNADGVSPGTVRRYSADGDFETALPVEAEPRGIALGDKGIWVANLESDSVSRIDLATDRVESFGVGEGARPARVAVGEEAAWVSNSGNGTLTEFTKLGQQAEQTGKVAGEPRGIAVAEGSVWVVDAQGSEVVEVDPDSGEATGESFRVGEDPRSMAFGFGSLWVANGADDNVSRIALPGGDLEEIEGVGTSPEGIAIDEANETVWVSAGDEGADGTVSRIRP
jgi:DNA-binding beta-propeller fold protein YncE